MIEGIDSVGVVGAGTMGSGIAQSLAMAGFQVTLYDVSEEVLDAGEERIQKGLERCEQPRAFSLVRKSTQMRKLGDCDAIIEAAFEDLAVKRELFTQLDRHLDPPKLLATNTSSLSIAKIASATENPDRVAGMHFFNPAAVMRLVEVVRAEHTSEDAIQLALKLARALGKTPIRCKDTPGFVANRVARPFYLAGMRLLEEGRGSPILIDRAMKEVGGFRMGPFELMDLIGLEVNFTITQSIFEQLGKPERLKPRRVQAELVKRGAKGRKNACGFYVYGENPPGTLNGDLEDLVPDMGGRPLAPVEIVREVVGAVIDEAKLAAQEGVAVPPDIDTAMKLGLNWPRGPFEWERELAR
ncbi:MAG: 3-hydroxybutyryl-CoA dehydrogenase [Elusimicrobia bacterium]|nr:3-hydroxybutyryl-CoA dehydrogenase [Elusimicrobiota bacterium]